MKEKQIEEMVDIIENSIITDNMGYIIHFDTDETSEALYNAGYRKASEVAKEIFELIECAFSPVLVYNGYTIKEYLTYLKKKYIGDSK